MTPPRDPSDPRLAAVVRAAREAAAHHFGRPRPAFVRLREAVRAYDEGEDAALDRDVDDDAGD